MKIRYNRLNLEYYLRIGELLFLTIEAPNYLDDLTRQLYFKTSDIGSSAVQIFDDEKEVVFKKKCHVFFSAVDVEMKSSVIRRQLFQELLYDMQQEDILDKYTKIKCEMMELMEMISGASQFNVEYDESFEEKDFFSIMNVNISNPEGTFIERLVDCIQTSHRLVGRELFIVVNCDKYLNTSDYLHLERFAQYERVSMLFINGSSPSISENITEYIIDKDLCEI